MSIHAGAYGLLFDCTNSFGIKGYLNLNQKYFAKSLFVRVGQTDYRGRTVLLVHLGVNRAEPRALEGLCGPDCPSASEINGSDKAPGAGAGLREPVRVDRTVRSGRSDKRVLSACR